MHDEDSGLLVVSGGLLDADLYRSNLDGFYMAAGTNGNQFITARRKNRSDYGGRSIDEGVAEWAKRVVVSERI